MSEHAMRNMTPTEKESYNKELSKLATKTGRNIQATKLLACRAALLDCVEALEVAQCYVESIVWTHNRDAETAQVESAITNARKALGE